MKYTLIHPSRGRAEKAFATMRKWAKAAVSKDFQYILSLDNDDPQAAQYMQWMVHDSNNNHSFVTNENENLVGAVHKAIPPIKGDCVIVISDDFEPCHEWDRQLTDVISHHKDENGIEDDYAVYVNDGATFGKELFTIPILSASLIRKLGYIYYPSYTGMFADNDLYEVCDKLGVIISAEHIVFNHEHYTRGKVAFDETYKRHNNNESWKFGQQLLKKRRALNFNIQYFGRPKFSILISTLIERRNEYNHLIELFDMYIYNNLADHFVDIVTVEDNRERSVGVKRQQLLEMAKGDWIAFFDDDDLPYSTYIPLIISAIKDNPDIDCIGINGVMTTNGKNTQRWCHRLGYPIANNMYGFDYVRPIWHFNPVLRSKALQVGFNDMTFGEDKDYALRLAPLLSNEFNIREPLFWYRYTVKNDHHTVNA